MKMTHDNWLSNKFPMLNVLVSLGFHFDTDAKTGDDIAWVRYKLGGRDKNVPTVYVYTDSWAYRDPQTPKFSSDPPRTERDLNAFLEGTVVNGLWRARKLHALLHAIKQPETRSPDLPF